MTRSSYQSPAPPLSKSAYAEFEHLFDEWMWRDGHSNKVIVGYGGVGEINDLADAAADWATKATGAIDGDDAISPAMMEAALAAFLAVDLRFESASDAVQGILRAALRAKKSPIMHGSEAAAGDIGGRRMESAQGERGRDRFDLIDQEQLAAQIVALMDAHFQRPSRDEKLRLLRLAQQQLGFDDGETSQEARLRPSIRLASPTPE